MAEHYSSFRGPWSATLAPLTELLVIPMMSNFPSNLVKFELIPLKSDTNRTQTDTECTSQGTIIPWGRPFLTIGVIQVPHTHH